MLLFLSSVLVKLNCDVTTRNHLQLTYYLAELCLMAGRQAGNQSDKIHVRLKVFKLAVDQNI